MDKNNSNKKKFFKEFKLHITLFFISLFSLSIGLVVFPISNNLKLIILPFIFSLFFSIFVYVFKPIEWIGNHQSDYCTELILIFVGPLLVKLAIASGQNIELLFDVGPILFLKELGSLGTIFMGLPIALYLGFRRESIGMTSSICREPQLAVLTEKYGFDSKEVKGFFIVYIIGIVLGTIFITFLVNILCCVFPLHPYSYALATGIGSTSMNVAAVSSLISFYPGLHDKILAFSGISNLISLVFGIYVYIFISLPVTEILYNKLQNYFK